ncbi:EAL domain-containing protein [Pelosinus sp. sgz500959]|uniref:EAL domain-containing protein n=1 Tax=Pelosinus sp. sgz500959 TaxID=3242472 RepID=UPI00367194F1
MIKDTLCILIIDDDDIDRQIIIRALKSAKIKHTVLEASDEEMGLSLLMEHAVDLIFIDYQLPGNDGLTVLRRLNSRGIVIPIIMLTGHGDETIAVEVMKAGAYDYCPKNKITPDFLQKLIQYSLECYESRQKILHAKERIHKLAYYDSLTTLPNRTLFHEHVTQQLKIALLNQEKLALIFLDIDRFKSINNTWGHSVGDSLLQGISSRLQMALPDQFIARMGGDEFMVLLTNATIQKAEKIARTIQTVLEPVFIYNDYRFYITSSIGIALYPDHGNQMDFLMRNADTAMYTAKNLGRNNYQIYTTDIGIALAESMSLTNELRPALVHDEFLLYYQPKVSIKTGRIVGAEALIRWRSPKYGMVGPDKFIKLAEETGFIITLGKWIFTTACQQLHQWQKKRIPIVPIAVNFSPKQLFHEQVSTMIKSTLKATGVDAHYLEIEITESAAIENEIFLQSLLHELRDMGIKIAIDDFGTGYSSLHHIIQYAVDTLKIDKSFIQKATKENSKTRLLVSTIITMAQNLGLSVIAEGVETEEQLAFLQEQGCDEFQGYLYSKPLPADEFIQLLLKQG